MWKMQQKNTKNNVENNIIELPQNNIDIKLNDDEVQDVVPEENIEEEIVTNEDVEE